MSRMYSCTPNTSQTTTTTGKRPLAAGRATKAGMARSLAATWTVSVTRPSAGVVMGSALAERA